MVLKLPFKIYAVMQHPNNKQPIPLNPVKHNMRLLANAPQSRGDGSRGNLLSSAA